MEQSKIVDTYVGDLSGDTMGAIVDAIVGAETITLEVTGTATDLGIV